MNNSVLEDKLLSKFSSILISGGFDKNGVLPLPEITYFESIFKKKLKINMHLGFYSKKQHNTLSYLKDHIKAFSFNFLPEEKSISHISPFFSPEDYLYSYRKFNDIGLNIFPHILLGLTDENGEHKIFDHLISFNPKKIILLVKIPLDPYEQLYPSIRLLQNIDYIKNILPNSDIFIGCMRPGGKWRKDTDKLLLASRISGIVNPAIPSKIRKEHKIKEECCVF